MDSQPDFVRSFHAWNAWSCEGGTQWDYYQTVTPKGLPESGDCLLPRPSSPPAPPPGLTGYRSLKRLYTFARGFGHGTRLLGTVLNWKSAISGLFHTVRLDAYRTSSHTIERGNP
jgi:hypothetical protein